MSMLRDDWFDHCLARDWIRWVASWTSRYTASSLPEGAGPDLHPHPFREPRTLTDVRVLPGCAISLLFIIVSS